MIKKILFIPLLFITLFAKQAQSQIKVPDNLRANRRTAYSAVLKWQAVLGARYYLGQVRNKRNAIVFVFAATKTKVKVDKGIYSNDLYSFSVKSCTEKNVCSNFSKAKKFRTKPAKIKSLRLISAAEDSATIQINKKPKGKISKYELEVKTDSASYKISLKNKVSQKKPSYEITGLSPSASYRVRGRAYYDSKNFGKYSPWLSFSTSDPILVGAGDIASCSSLGDEETADLLDNISGTVFTAGDNAYPNGAADEFLNCYEPSWGRHKSRTRPTPGNHDYNTPGALTYFSYFGDKAGEAGNGYYSYDLGKWHIIALNSNCSEIGGCSAGSPQETWLRSDLVANQTDCTLAYMHHPRFSSGPHGNQAALQNLWQALYEYGAEIVVSGHDHIYERFAPQNPAGAASDSGIRQFVVGTGGASLYNFGAIAQNSEIRDNSSHGVIKFTLKPQSYAWEFVPASSGAFSDSGIEECH